MQDREIAALKTTRVNLEIFTYRRLHLQRTRNFQKRPLHPLRRISKDKSNIEAPVFEQQIIDGGYSIQHRQSSAVFVKINITDFRKKTTRASQRKTIGT